MLPQGWILLLFIAGTVTALGPAPHQTSEESLRSAYDAVTRKQRSLDANSQEYYNDLRSFKYHGPEPDRKLDRDREGDWEADEEDEEIEFLPNETGQLETVGNGFQGLNNKFLERAVMDYLDTVPEQEEPVTSLFRERERSSSRKRGNGAERLSTDNQETLDGSPYGLRDVDDEEYLDALQMLYNGYKGVRGNDKPYENENPTSCGESVNKEPRGRGQNREMDDSDVRDRDQDQSVLYLTPAERRNVNGRYPIGRDFKTHRNFPKRYPVSKRSPKPLPIKKQITDPKVAQDLGALFGTQSTDGHNHTHGYDHQHDHDHDHGHDHDHEHNHDHDHEHEHSEQHKHDSSSEPPKVTSLPKGQKENMTKVGKSKSIEVRKKSVDWSEYFGIDRRRKKAAFMPGQGTQKQADEWMLQRYYETMAENLKPEEGKYEKENAERKDKVEQMNTKWKNIQDLIVAEAQNYGDSEDSTDLQKVKDKVMARMVAAYSLEKMRKALIGLANSVAARMEEQKLAAQNNQTANYRENDSVDRTEDKRSGKSANEAEGTDESKSCLEMEAIEKACKTITSGLGPGLPHVLYHPCVMLLACKACDEGESYCLRSYETKVRNSCSWVKQTSTLACRNAALFLSHVSPPADALQCSINRDSCLRKEYYIPYSQLRYGIHA